MALLYPITNNTLVYSITAGEVTTTGSHVGRGMGFHYHADGHSLTGNGINLYNLDDYTGSYIHPWLVLFSMVLPFLVNMKLHTIIMTAILILLMNMVVILTINIHIIIMLFKKTPHQIVKVAMSNYTAHIYLELLLRD